MMRHMIVVTLIWCSDWHSVFRFIHNLTCGRTRDVWEGWSSTSVDFLDHLHLSLKLEVKSLVNLIILRFVPQYIAVIWEWEGGRERGARNEASKSLRGDAKHLTALVREEQPSLGYTFDTHSIINISHTLFARTQSNLVWGMGIWKAQAEHTAQRNTRKQAAFDYDATFYRNDVRSWHRTSEHLS